MTLEDRQTASAPPGQMRHPPGREKLRPALLAAIARPNRAAGGGYLIYFAWTTKPDGYTWPDVPNAFIDVIARVLT